MADITLGSIHSNLTINITQFTHNLRMATTNIVQVRQNILSLQQTVHQAATQMNHSLNTLRTTLVGYAGIRLFRGALDDLGSFDQKVAELRAVVQENANFSVEALARLRQEALRLGATTIYGPAHAAEGMTELARSGFSADQVLQMIQPTLRMASVEHLNLAEAVKFVSGTLRQFGLDASYAENVTDLLTKGSAISQTSVRNLGIAMSYVGPNAANLGISVKETVAVLAALSQANIDATRAGMGLRAVLQGLIQDAPKHTRVLKEMGLTYADIDPTKVGLTRALETLKEKQIDVSRATVLMRANGATALLGLLQNLKAIKDFTLELDRAAGTTDRMARTSTNNLRDAFTQLTNVVSVATIQLGDEGATGAIRSMVDALTNALRALTGFLSPLAEGARLAYALGEALKALAVIMGTIVAIKLGGLLAAFIVGSPLVAGIAAVAGALSGLYGLMESENRRFADMQRSVNRLIEDMQKVSNDTTRVHIQNLRKQADETVRMMQVELARLRAAGGPGFWEGFWQSGVENAKRGLTRELRTAADFLSRMGERFLGTGTQAPGTEGAARQDPRVARLEAELARLETERARLAPIEGVVPPPQVYRPDVEAFHEADKSAAREALKAARERFETERENFRNLLQQQRERLDLTRAEWDINIELARQSHDQLRLAEAEGTAKQAALVIQRDMLEEALTKAKALAALTVDTRQAADVAGEVARLELQRQQLIVEERLVALQGTYALHQAQIRQEQERINASLGFVVTAYQGVMQQLEGQTRTAMTLMEQHNAQVLQNLQLRGMSEDTLNLTRYQQAVALTQMRYDTEQKLYQLRLTMVQAEIANLTEQNKLVQRKEDELRIAQQLMQKQYELQALQAAPPIKTQVLKPLTELEQAAAAFPREMAQSLTSGITDLMAAFRQGSTDIGTAIQGMGQKILDTALKPLMAQVTAALHELIQSLGSAGTWVAGALGIAMVALGGLLHQVEAKVEQLGDKIATNIEQVERTRGLIAGEQQIAIQQLSANLSQAFRPTNEILLRCETLLRLIAQDGTLASLTFAGPVPSQALYASEILGSARMG